MIHSGNQKYGENLYSCYASYGICVTGEKASQKWYDEVGIYNFNNPGYISGAGHFTQLVWKGSNQIGCGAACNSNNKCYLTCNYYPPGNYLNQFASNVFPLKEEEGGEGGEGIVSDEGGNDNPNNQENTYNVKHKGMSTAGKVFLAIFIILVILLIAASVFHFVIKKRKVKDIKYYFIKSYYS